MMRPILKSGKACFRTTTISLSFCYGLKKKSCQILFKIGDDIFEMYSITVVLLHVVVPTSNFQVSSELVFTIRQPAYIIALPQTNSQRKVYYK